MIFAPLLARLHHPLEADGMVLGHRRAHDEDGVGVGQILLRGGGAAASERCAQTGHGGAVSYPGLVADANHAQTSAEKFLDQVIFFVIESGAAEMRDRPWSASPSSPSCSSTKVRSRLSHTRSATMSMAVSRSSLLPLGGVRPAILHLHQAVGMGVQFEGVGALGTEMAARDRASRDRLRWRSARHPCERPSGRSRRRSRDRWSG